MRLSRYLVGTQAMRALGPATVSTLGRVWTRRTVGKTLLGSGLLAASFSSLNPRAESSEDAQEKDIGASGDFVEGQMREIQVGADKEKDVILVARYEGKLYALGAKCSHFGAPMAQGQLFDDVVFCPWHLARFDIKTGYAESGPMMDSLPTYKIEEKGGRVLVTVPKTITVNRVPIKTTKRDPANKTRYLIVGGGPAGASAAEALRQSGFTGEILILTAEENLPYDRSILTKNIMKVEPKAVELRAKEHYTDLGIDVKTKTQVTALLADKKQVQVSTGEKYTYDKILIATGAKPKTLTVPGNSLKNVLTVRDFSDIYKVRESIKGAKNVVIIGGGLIGCETASNLKLDLKDAINVTVVSRGAPMHHHFGKDVGGILQKLGEENGVKYIKDTVASLEGEGSVKKVKLSNGQAIDADVVITAIGVTPNTWFLKGLALDQDGGMNADVFLRSTSNKDVYGAGDVVSYPYFYTAERIRTEHLSEAFAHGTHAAWNMLGKMVPYSGVPFYWTRQFNKSIGCIGVLQNYDQVILDGKPSEYNFAAYYLRKGQVVGAAGMMRGKDLITLNQAMRLGVKVTDQHFTGTALNVDKLKAELVGKGKSCNCHCLRSKMTDAPCRV